MKNTLEAMVTAAAAGICQAMNMEVEAMGLGDMQSAAAKRPKERIVQALWYDAGLRPVGLRTTKGEKVKVLDPGRWNLEAGPDFLDAVLAIGPHSRRLRGDVEIHVCPSDWTGHAHGGDPAYRNVVAHVTWQNGKEPCDLPEGAVSIVMPHVKNAFPAKTLAKGWPYCIEPQGPAPCRNAFPGGEREIEAMLVEAGRERLRLKAEVFRQRMLRGEDCLQVFWEAFLAGLGWKRNSEGFLRLAQLLPWRELPGESCAAYSALHGAAMLVEWKRGGTRPCNSPEARLGAAARLGAPCGALPEVMGKIDLAARKGIHAAMETLCRAGAENLPFASTLGRGRAAALLLNVVVPFEAALGRVSISGLARLPAEDVSEPVRTLAHRMGVCSPRIMSNGIALQGLLHIAGRFCGKYRRSACHACPIARSARRTGLSAG